MVLVPSIDILGGRCVRLLQGDYGSVTSYGDDPAAVAGDFRDRGARRIHVVDLDAAHGNGHNRRVIAAIRRQVAVVLQVGGGVRSDGDVRELLELGVDRLVVGTVLARDPDAVARWTAAYGPRILAGIDARDGKVKISGWEEGTSQDDVALARTAAGVGCVGVVYTSIARDGTLAGPDLERTARVADGCGLPVVLSGGVGSDRDIERVAEAAHPRIVAVITGKAVYEGKVDLDRMLRKYADPGAAPW